MNAVDTDLEQREFQSNPWVIIPARIGQDLELWELGDKGGYLNKIYTIEQNDDEILSNKNAAKAVQHVNKLVLPQIDVCASSCSIETSFHFHADNYPQSCPFPSNTVVVCFQISNVEGKFGHDHFEQDVVYHVFGRPIIMLPKIVHQKLRFTGFKTFVRKS